MTDENKSDIRWMDAPSCGTCRYATTTSDPAFCRRRAPTLVPGEVRGSWPLVALTDWCGEFRSKPLPPLELGDKLPEVAEQPIDARPLPCPTPGCVLQAGHKRSCL